MLIYMSEQKQKLQSLIVTYNIFITEVIILLHNNLRDIGNYLHSAFEIIISCSLLYL